MRITPFALILSPAFGCATLKQDSLDARFGRADPTRFDPPVLVATGGSYQREVQPLFERRCIVCHGCCDAPCQLKLGSFDGIARGASKEPVYDAARQREAAPTRLFVDAQRPPQWRAKRFEPVRNERTPSPQNNLAASVLYRSLALKRAHPLPYEKVLLDEAEFFIMNFIKGPVWRGQTALDVIEDRFWVFFLDPKTSADDAVAQLLARQADDLRLPAANGSNARVLGWRELAQREDRVLAAKGEFIRRRQSGASAPNLAAIWDDDGRNTNAALTVFRHFDSASVVKGLVGDAPHTAWVIGDPLLERVYYLLAAGYDPYGNIGHQVQSRLYMDFMRMEGESSFLLFLPKATRGPTRDFWYRGASDEVKAHVGPSQAHLEPETGIAYRSADPPREFFELVSRRLAPVLDRRFELADVADAPLRRSLQAVAAVRGASLSWLPDSVVLRVDDPPRAPGNFTLLRDTGHANVTHLLREKAALLPDENALSVVPGFIGAYPNAILRSTPAQLPALAAALASLTSEADYMAFADRFVIRRTSADFWAASDAMHAAYAKASPRESGLFDYSRLDNR